VDETVVAEIDADMGVGWTLCVEKDQIAGCEFIRIHGFGGLADRPGVVREIQAQGVPKYMPHEAAAIEAFPSNGASVRIRGVGQAERVNDQLGPLVPAQAAVALKNNADRRSGLSMIP
jgi:hypothetical protein